MRSRVWLPVLAVAALSFAGPTSTDAACCYFSAKNADIQQPAQKVFITWDPVKQQESFLVQPKFEGNAADFGMVIPTPAKPKLHELPRHFFWHLAVFTLLKQRPTNMGKAWENDGKNHGDDLLPPPTIVILEQGVVGSLDYKIIEADRADDLYKWLKDNKYHYAGDEATLNHYVQKKWVFTVMKIDNLQMKRNKDGAGEIAPARFTFTTDKLIYPLKIARISAKDKTEVLFYVQAPTKMDLPGTLSYQHTWVPLLLSAVKKTSKGYADNLPGQLGDWLRKVEQHIPGLLQKNEQLGFVFVRGHKPKPNQQGRTPTRMEWAHKLSKHDIKVLEGKAPYSDDKLQRHAPEAAIRAMQELVGRLEVGQFITKFRKTFTRGEMEDDLLLVPARLGDAVDDSEYEEVLPVSPP